MRGDRTLVSNGAVHTPKRIASIRKSLVSALFGIAVAEGRVNLDATLEELGVDDYSPLTDIERGATGARQSRSRNLLALQQLGLQRPRRNLSAHDT